MRSEFWIYFKKWQREVKKANNWWVYKKRLKGIDRQIAELYELKHNKKALRYLKLTNKWLKKSMN